MNAKRRVYFYYFAPILLLIFISACNKNNDEFANLPNTLQPGEGPLDFLEGPGGLSDDYIQTSTDLANNLFEPEYKNIKEWGSVKLSQQEFNIKKLDSSDLLTTIKQSRIILKNLDYYSKDTRIGSLIDPNDTNEVNKAISNLIQLFFSKMKDNTLDKEISRFVLRSEIPVISRQISKSKDYAKEIVDLRIGRIQIANTDGRSALIRVIRNNPNLQARGEFQFYFTYNENKWFISAIEGDFAQLYTKYDTTKQFTPLGTTGVTQGF